MAELSVSLHGAKDVDRKFKRMPIRLARVMNKLVAESALNIQREARRLCPVDTGRLRSSIQVAFFAGGLGATVGTIVHYAPYIEFGTRYMKPRPYLGPAYENEIKKFRRKVIVATKSVIRKA